MHSRKGGWPPDPLALTLQLNLLQQCFLCSDPAMEALIEVPIVRGFAGIELITDRIPDETTMRTFRHPLETWGSGEQIFDRLE